MAGLITRHKDDSKLSLNSSRAVTVGIISEKWSVQGAVKVNGEDSHLPLAFSGQVQVRVAPERWIDPATELEPPTYAVRRTTISISKDCVKHTIQIQGARHVEQLNTVANMR